MNIQERSLSQKHQVFERTLMKSKGVVMCPLGDDFRYDKDVEWDQQYKKYMKLMRFINSKPQTFNMTLRFSVVKDYFNILNRFVPQNYIVHVDFGYSRTWKCYTFFSIRRFCTLFRHLWRLLGGLFYF